MMEPAFYDHPCQEVEPVQTLTGWLLFAGDLIYKIKKPVLFRFVDARTPAKRYRLCHDEVALNGRLAPGVYLGVVGIARRTGSFQLVPNPRLNQPGVREFAIVMHRLPSARMLSRMVANSEIAPADIQQLAEKLATFHLNCSTAKSKIRGSAAALSRLIAAVLADAQAVIADTVMREQLVVAARYLRGYVLRHHQLLDRRARNGRVREGHGDLRAESVWLVPEAPAVIGCVEFSEALRYCDVASDLAALVLDLERAGRNDLADTLVQRYIAASEDAELSDLLPFYKCYRAVRRGQREMLTSLQTEMPWEHRMLARQSGGQWLRLAQHIAAANSVF
jgi:aminoglycoside phosphotransferase family enzyme